jgi:hypothetical protein
MQSIILKYLIITAYTVLIQRIVKHGWVKKNIINVEKTK